MTLAETRLEIIKKTYDRLDTKRLRLERIKDVSCYNYNFYVGRKRLARAVCDILLGISDDDRETEWWIIGNHKPQLLGYSDVEDEILEVVFERRC